MIERRSGESLRYEGLTIAQRAVYLRSFHHISRTPYTLEDAAQAITLPWNELSRLYQRIFEAFDVFGEK